MAGSDGARDHEPRIRSARPGDLPALPRIEAACEHGFVALGLAIGPLTDPEVVPDELRAACAEGRLFVAVDDADQPIGLVYVDVLDGRAYLDELDVLPAWQRRGIGAALVHTACAWAAHGGHTEIDLVTFRDVPWNGPFYAGLGFRELPASAHGPELVELLAGEVARGMDGSARCGMRATLPIAAPYGAWPSPIDADALGARLRIAYPTFGPDGASYWVEVRPEDQGRGVLVALGSDGTRRDVVSAPFDVRSRVHEYGGRAYVVCDDGRIVFSNDGDRALYVVDRLGGSPARLTDGDGTRFAEPVHDRARNRLIAVTERHPPPGAAGGAEPTNELAAVSLADGAVRALATGRDFYAAPALSPDGARLAWLAWDHPHMPWDAAELWVARVDADGTLADARQVAGDTDGAAFQPLWTRDGRLWFTLERGDRFALHQVDGDPAADGIVRAEPAGAFADGELGAPLWQLGTRVLAETDVGLVGVVARGSRSVVVHLGGPGRGSRTLTDTLGTVGDLAARGGRVIAAVGWAGGAGALAELDVHGPAPVSPRLLCDVDAGIGALDASIPEEVRFPTGDGSEIAHAFFYPPRRAGLRGPDGARPPLIVIAHGGPTAATSTPPGPRVWFFTSRGYAVLDVNYRGSTGYGRAYRRRMHGGWGIVDVEDCVAGARWCADTGRVDGARMVIRGGSAGGYTVLQALANHDVFRAGACYYGISDLVALLAETHKFESRYDRTLVGRWPEDRALFEARSPVHYPERIRVPVVFFQGLEDRSVPPDQTERMARILRERGVDAEYHGYPGEQHGFRKAENLRHAHRTELAFYRRVLAASASSR